MPVGSGLSGLSLVVVDVGLVGGSDGMVYSKSPEYIIVAKPSVLPSSVSGQVTVFVVVVVLSVAEQAEKVRVQSSWHVDVVDSG